MSDNLSLWQAVEKTPPAHTKAITGKSYQGTSPKPHYLVHKATETFGPCGIGWGFTIVDERIEEGAGGERMHIARVKVWYEWSGKRGEVEHIGGTQFCGIRSSGKPFTDEDAPKKSVTDALVKALSMIGFAGDIFMGRYDDSKYVQELRDEARQESAPMTGRNAPAAVARTPAAGAPLSELGETFRKDMMLATTKDELGEWMSANSGTMKEKLGEDGFAQIRKLAAERYATLPEAQVEAAE
jgi:hypothetical protein